ncbi:MAG TPA: conjugal transfer protein TrbF [Verrucomicrobiae bacterium]|nr:conjugal transfer protein TrbF [Verrucomicrobiae bacterium]
MNFAFRAPIKSAAGPEPSTPYQRARQEWDTRMGSAIVSARVWRAIALVAAGLVALLSLGLTFVALQQRTFVHVVEVAPEGQVLSVRTAERAWTPSEAQTAYHLGRFIRLVRTLPTDGVVLRENWLEAYRFLTPQAAARLTEIARADDPFLSLGRVGRTVSIRSVIARSNNTWEVSWIERTANGSGIGDAEAYSGVFTLTLRPPRNADDLATNPLGLLISDFSWSRVR